MRIFVAISAVMSVTVTSLAFTSSAVASSGIAQANSDPRSVARSQASILRGSVRLADGTPWQNANVVVEAVGTASAMNGETQASLARSRLVTRSDTRGRYRLELVPGMSYRLFAWSRSGETLRFAGPREVVPGRERPLVAWAREVAEPLIRTRGLAAWKRALGDGMKLVDERGIEVEILERNVLRFRPHPLCKRVLHVLDARGFPAVAQRVQLRPGPRDLEIDPPGRVRLRVTLGKKLGREFRIRLPFGDRATRYLDAGKEGIDLPCAISTLGEISGLRLELQPRGCPETHLALDGIKPERVGDRSIVHLKLNRGLPVGGVLRSTKSSTAGRRLRIWAACNRIDEVTLATAQAVMNGVAIDCDAKGRFRSSSILNNGYSLFAELTPAEAGRLDDGTPVAPLALVRGQQLRSTELDCDLDALTLVRVTVRDHRGEPVRGASIMLANSGATFASGPRFTCDRRGRIAFRIHPGTLVAFAACSDDAYGSRGQRAHGVTAVDLRLRKPLILEGRLLEDSGAPIAGVTFHLDDWSLQSLLFGDRMQSMLPRPSRQTTDEKGRFRIRLPGPTKNVFVTAIPSPRLDQSEVEALMGSIQLEQIRESRRDLEWSRSDFN